MADRYFRTYSGMQKKGHFKIFPKKQKTSQITAQVSTIMLVIKIFHSSFRKQGKTVIV